jgi:hypothetical protein
MPDSHLSNSETLQSQEGGQKAMHPVLKSEPLQAGPSKYFQRAAGIPNRLPQHAVSNRIGNPGNETTRERVTAPYSISHERVERSERVEHDRNIRRIGLEIGIHGDNQLTTRCLESSIQG